MITKLSITKRNFTFVCRNIFYFNRQNKTQPFRTKTRERLTKRNRLMVPDKNKINKINFLPQGHFFIKQSLIPRVVLVTLRLAFHMPIH